MTTDDSANEKTGRTGSDSDNAETASGNSGGRNSGRASSATRNLRRGEFGRMILRPTVVLTILTALLGVMYLDYVADPEGNLHGFPIAVVNMDVGDVTATGAKVDFGKQVTDALVAGIPADKVDLRVIGVTESERQLRNGEIYGAIVIPGDFSKRLGILGAGSIVAGEMERPVITLQTNPRLGAFGTQITERIGQQALTEVDKQVGVQLTDQVKAALAEGNPAPQVSGAAMLTLQHPVDIVESEFRPLPNGTGEGLTAFFYALLLLLAGMIGAMIVHTMTDAHLGFVPNEYGPFYLHHEPVKISRFGTLLVKWAVMVVVSLVVALVYILVAEALNMPIGNAFGLYLFSVLCLIACGWTGLTVLAAFGTPGLIINMILFVILGLPSSGGTVPIEATPKYLTWLAEFEPMHQVYLGVRSILYFDSNYDAGLGRGTFMAFLGIVIAVVLGTAVTKYYDSKGLHRENLLARPIGT
ncbi:YhgE/Pip domain-containing protein [Nocardia sp. NPDC058705]|uniref:YhgE/Pip domain-containing protein n=1 Tax=Nocardia sp. NPDC058705 TaxID=3346609 RepID=UPI0036791600